MKFFLTFLSLVILLVACWNENKNKQIAEDKPVEKIILPDSIEAIIAALEANTNIKQVRKRYELGKGVEVKLGKYYLYGDTNKVVKVREEIVSLERNDIIVYYFADSKLFQIHDYFYRKNCPVYKTICAIETKYYFDSGKFDSAIRREVASPDGKSEPQISQAGFSNFILPDTLLPQKLNQLENINKKFITLPAIKAKRG
jgi:hypothetical protein